MNRQYLFFVAMGFELVALVLIFLYIGRHIDNAYRLNGLGIAGCLIGGLVIWFIHILFQLKKISGDDEE